MHIVTMIKVFYDMKWIYREWMSRQTFKKKILAVEMFTKTK
jgi:hypothetical protein